MAKMIAKTTEGKEYFYNPNSAHAVSDAGAEEICKVLNEKRWRLRKPEEKKKWGTKMSIHTFKIHLRNGETFKRCEWGRTKKSALRTLWGVYGRENIVAAIAI